MSILLNISSYKAMLGRSPPSEDGVATELILMDEWVQELCIAQEEAFVPTLKVTWEAGNQVMLWADCKGKGRSKKLSKKWTGLYTIIEVCSP